MPSNVRNYDRSCWKTSLSKITFYKCSTCDPAKLTYFCERCKNNSRHNGHRISKVNNANLNIFCHCGDISGLIHCSKHQKTSVKNCEQPLHINIKQMDVFLKEFNLIKANFAPIAALNQIRRIDPKSSDGKLIKHYFDSSKIQNNVNSKIIRSWSVYRKDAEVNYVKKGFDKDRKMLLWHGTKTHNLSSILDIGFRKPNQPGQVATGSMFGKGVYFADRSTLSAWFCDKNGEGILFLCEVSLGSMWRTGLAKDYQNVPNNYDSIKGVGKNKPNPNGKRTFNGNIIIPAGASIPHPHPKIGFSQIDYNEYILFDPERALVKFIVQIVHA